MNAIAPGAPAQHHARITRLHIAWVSPAWCQTNCAAKDQRIGGVALFVEYRTIHGWNAHFVAIIAHARYHASRNRARVQHPGWQIRVGGVGEAKAKHIGVGNWLGRHAHHIAHHAAHASIRAAEWLQCGRVVVCLDLDRNLVSLAKRNDASVIDKRRDDPGVRGQGLGFRMRACQYFAGCLHQKGLYQAVNLNLWRAFQQSQCGVVFHLTSDP